MKEVPRRRWLGVLGTATLVGSAGCLSEDQPEFLVTNSEVVAPAGATGIRVRITVENERSERQDGTLEVTLDYPPSGDSWQQTDEISVSRGTTPQYRYIFDGVYEEGNDVQEYVVDAEIRVEE